MLPKNPKTASVTSSLPWRSLIATLLGPRFAFLTLYPKPSYSQGIGVASPSDPPLPDRFPTFTHSVSIYLFRSLVI